MHSTQRAAIQPYLVDGLWIAEAPTACNVGFADLVASVTAAARRYMAPIARPAVVFLLGVVQNVRVTPQLRIV